MSRRARGTTSGGRASKDSGVMVFCRFRPPNRAEKEAGSGVAVEIVKDKAVYVDVGPADTFDDGRKRDHSGGKAVFAFDRSFGPESTQEEVYEHTAASYAADVMEGFNCTVFAYGQTGSGKTHTMMGDKKSPGIIPRLTQAVFALIEAASASVEFTIKVSYVEIYMERMSDLLDPQKTNLRVREGTRGVWVEGAEERYVSTEREVHQLMAKGGENRHTASTRMNDASSRSHSVLIMTVGQRNLDTGSKIGSKLILVDLAGSESVRKTGASGSTLDEAKHINRSLSALGNVINALTSGGAHVPYRDSKLTRLLSDSLGGSSKTCLIVTASPVTSNSAETVSTLRFGTRAKSIKNKPHKNKERSVAEYRKLLDKSNARVAMLEKMVKRLRADLTRLKDIVRAGEALPDDFERLGELEDLEEELGVALASPRGIKGGTRQRAETAAAAEADTAAAAAAAAAPAAGDGGGGGGGDDVNWDDVATRDRGFSDLEIEGDFDLAIKKEEERAQARALREAEEALVDEQRRRAEMATELRELQREAKEKDDAFQQMQELLAEKDGELESVQIELEEREARVLELEIDSIEKLEKSAAAAADGGGPEAQEALRKAEAERDTLRSQLDEQLVLNRELTRLADIVARPAPSSRRASAMEADIQAFQKAPVGGGGGGGGGGSGGGHGGYQLASDSDSSSSDDEDDGGGRAAPPSTKAAAGDGSAAAPAEAAAPAPPKPDSPKTQAMKQAAETQAATQAAKMLAMEEELEDTTEKYEILLEALQRKCEEYALQQSQLSAANRRIAELEKNGGGGGGDANAAERIRALEKEVERVTAVSQKLLQSGQYWQQRSDRKARELRARQQRDAEREAALRARGERLWYMPRQSAMPPISEADGGGGGGVAVGARPRSQSRVVKPVHFRPGGQQGKPPLQRDGSMDQFF